MNQDWIEFNVRFL